MTWGDLFHIIAMKNKVFKVLKYAFFVEGRSSLSFAFITSLLKDREGTGEPCSSNPANVRLFHNRHSKAAMNTLHILNNIKTPTE